MSNSAQPPISVHYGAHLGFTWSPREKAIARKAFHLALDLEFEEIIRETRNRAAKIKEPPDLWELEDFLTRSRKRIDREYDYRYSVLPMVFAILLRKGRIEEDDLKGLSEDKLDLIRRGAAL